MKKIFVSILTALILLINFNTAIADEKQYIIMLDAGHGGYDAGAISYNKNKEKDINLKLTLLVGQKLKQKGIKVLYTRTEDKYLSLLERVHLANQYNPDLFLSIHMNSFNLKYVKGTEVYYYKDKQNKIEKILAENLQKNIYNTLKTKNRKVRQGDYTVISLVNSPAILIEPGYISNKQEEQNILKNLNSLADCIVKTITDNQKTSL